MRKKSIISLALVLLMICSGFICSAETVSYAPYKGYEYNDADESQSGTCRLFTGNAVI